MVGEVPGLEASKPVELEVIDLDFGGKGRVLYLLGAFAPVGTRHDELAERAEVVVVSVVPSVVIV